MKCVPAPLPGGAAKHPGDSLPEPVVGVADDQQHALQSPAPDCAETPPAGPSSVDTSRPRISTLSIGVDAQPRRGTRRSRCAHARGTSQTVHRAGRTCTAPSAGTLVGSSSPRRRDPFRQLGDLALREALDAKRLEDDPPPSSSKRPGDTPPRPLRSAPSLRGVAARAAKWGSSCRGAALGICSPMLPTPRVPGPLAIPVAAVGLARRCARGTRRRRSRRSPALISKFTISTSIVFSGSGADSSICLRNHSIASMLAWCGPSFLLGKSPLPGFS